MNTLILEDAGNGMEVPVDVHAKLAQDRILFITDQITDRSASEMVATLLLKDAEDSESKVTIFINSDGCQDIRNIFSIYDVMKMIECPIETVCIGAAMDEAVLLLAAGTKGMRYMTKNSLTSVGPIVNDWMMQTDLTEAKQILDLTTKDNKKFMTAFASCVGKTLKQVTSDFDKTVFMNAKDCLSYGIIDEIVKSK